MCGVDSKAVSAGCDVVQNASRERLQCASVAQIVVELVRGGDDAVFELGHGQQGPTAHVYCHVSQPKEVDGREVGRRQRPATLIWKSKSTRVCQVACEACVFCLMCLERGSPNITS